jgi:magnesium-transporting ATPase (P-type)
MARLVMYTLYKNVVFVVTQYWFSFFNGFSGQKFYVEYGTQTFNLLYTALVSMFGHCFSCNNISLCGICSLLF